MTRLLVMMLGLALAWPQLIAACSLPDACSAACAKCECSMVCCPANDSENAAPLAPAPENLFVVSEVPARFQWALPDNPEPAPIHSRSLPGRTVPLFLRDCAQLI